MKRFIIIVSIGLFCGVLLWETTCMGMDWETGIKTGFDTNIDRAIREEKSDSYLSGYLLLNRAPTGESRFDWIAGATVEGSAYNRYSDLSYGLINVTPGFVYIPHRLISVTASALFEAKAVRDSDQSALAMGGRLMIREQISPSFYLAQYCLIKASAASVDTYSFTETAFGVLTGITLSRRVAGEIGYEYSRGDSYRSVTSSTTTSSTAEGRRRLGRERSPKYSETFDQLLIREPVNRHAISAGLSLDWSKVLLFNAGYAYTYVDGTSGTSDGHAGFLGVSYRF